MGVVLQDVAVHALASSMSFELLGEVCPEDFLPERDFSVMVKTKVVVMVKKDNGEFENLSVVT